MEVKLSAIRVRPPEKQDIFSAGSFEMIFRFDNDRYQAVSFSERSTVEEVVFQLQLLAENIKRDEHLK